MCASVRGWISVCMHLRLCTGHLRLWMSACVVECALLLNYYCIHVDNVIIDCSFWESRHRFNFLRSPQYFDCKCENRFHGMHRHTSRCWFPLDSFQATWKFKWIGPINVQDLDVAISLKQSTGKWQTYCAISCIQFALLWCNKIRSKMLIKYFAWYEQNTHII